MFLKLSAAIKGLSLGGAFSKTVRTDSTASTHKTLSESMRNHDTQPLHYTTEQRIKPAASKLLTVDVGKHKRMGNLEDRRILEP
jgi:hypothetical protein